MIQILIGGDVYPKGRIQKAFVEGNAHEIFHDLLEEIENADLSVVNLESPLVSQENPIVKAGPVLGSSTKCIKGFSSSKWHVLNLANNHIFDHGASGLRETIQTIEKAGLSFVGAGSNLKEAQTPLIREISGQRITIYSMAEREFSIAGEKTPGANPLDIANFMYAIRRYKQHGVFIVLIHGGKEYYPYPSPEMVRRCRFMIEMGANAVICCHTHCPLPWEIYADRPIIYGLGNLIFDAIRKEPDVWHEGYLAKLTFDDREVLFEAVPYFQSKERPGAQKMDQTSRERFSNKMQERNEEIKDFARLEDRWIQYCRQRQDKYLSELFGYNHLMYKLWRPLLKKLHSKESVLNALLLVQCESHREILTTILKNFGQEE